MLFSVPVVHVIDKLFRFEAKMLPTVRVAVAVVVFTRNAPDV